MPKWNPAREPSHFPALWHSALRGEPSMYLLAQGQTLAGVTNLQKKFAVFKGCLKARPNHQTTLAMRGKTFRLHKDQRPDGSWQLWLRVRWEPAALVERAERGGL